MNENIIELQRVRKCYVKDTAVIEEINLQVKKGEFVTLLGPSGCGKTTILRLIGGFEMPTDGKILLHGKDISKVPPGKRPINTVFQKYALFPHLNIYDNIAFGLHIKKMPKDKIDEKVKRVLEIVDLEGFEGRSVQTLSGGQQQRIAIARAIVNEPEILLLDEPLGALDYKMRKEMQLELKEMHKELGITFIFVTHDQDEALTMSDKIVVMADGRIQQAGTPEEIYNEPANAFVADFIGESNIFGGVMTGKFKAKFCGAEFDCVDDYPLNTKVEAVVRPEDVMLMKPDKGKISGSVISSIFKGTFYEITVQQEKNEIVAQSQKNIPDGTVVGIDIEPDNIHIMPYNLSHNYFVGKVDDEFYFHLPDGRVRLNMAKLFPGSHEVDGQLFDENGSIIDFSDKLVELRFASADAVLSDEPDAGVIQGHITSLIYKGDHYSYTVRGRSENDYYANDEYLWNIGDDVSVIIPENKFLYQLKESEKTG